MKMYKELKDSVMKLNDDQLYTLVIHYEITLNEAHKMYDIVHSEFIRRGLL